MAPAPTLRALVLPAPGLAGQAAREGDFPEIVIRTTAYASRGQSLNPSLAGMFV